MPTPDEMRELNERFVQEVFNNHNVDFVSEALADDFAEHADVPPGMTPDKAGAIQWFSTMFQMSSDLKCEVADVLVSGDKMATRSIIRGTDTGGAMPGVPATNKVYEIESIDIVRVNDQGQFADHWGITDTMTMMMQLGLAPAGPPPA